MRWQGGRRSTNVNVRRGGMGPGMVGGGIGTVVLVLLAALFGVDPSSVIQGGGSGTQEEVDPSTMDPAYAEKVDFVRAVVGYTEDTWTRIFQQNGLGDYPEPQLEVFSGAINSACGFAQSAMGPFYCPRDQKVYIDLSFYDQLQQQLGAPGDFAQAYVIAHEVGHHVQTVTGISQQVDQARRGRSEAEGNALSVRQELQADCFAGLWAAQTQQVAQILEAGDVEEALNAASAIGDDRLQKQSQGYVVPESFTHGTSAQRVQWFRRGLEGGSLKGCDTFAAGAL
jgi:uncharacterized protein